MFNSKRIKKLEEDVERLTKLLDQWVEDIPLLMNDSENDEIEIVFTDQDSAQYILTVDKERVRKV